MSQELLFDHFFPYLRANKTKSIALSSVIKNLVMLKSVIVIDSLLLILLISKGNIDP